LKRIKIAADEEFEKNFKKNYPFLWKTTLFGPAILTLLILLVFYITYGAAYIQRLIWTVLLTFFFFGRFVILAGGDQDISTIQRFFSSEFLFLMVLYMDFLVATLLVFHSGFLFKIPWIGTRLGDLANDGQFILKKNPWIRRATFAGLIAFVTFPLAATGSIGGALFSRILGMGRGLAFMGIMIGSFFGCGVMYFGSQLINKYLARDNPIVTFSGIALVALIIICMNLWYKNLKKRDEQENDNSSSS